jgi:hypothetical protein
MTPVRVGTNCAVDSKHSACAGTPLHTQQLLGTTYTGPGLEKVMSLSPHNDCLAPRPDES